VAQAHGCLPQRPGLSPKAVHVGFMVDRSGTETDFSDYVGFPLSASFHQCTILVFNLPSVLYLSQKSHELIFSIIASPSNSLVFISNDFFKLLKRVK
jgi:hypothetical protein